MILIASQEIRKEILERFLCGKHRRVAVHEIKTMTERSLSFRTRLQLHLYFSL